MILSKSSPRTRQDGNSTEGQLQQGELESWTDLVLVQEMMVEAADGVHLWEGLNLWQVLQKEIGAIPGANNPISVTVKSKDGYFQELIQGIGIDGLINGKVEGNTRVPVILGYAKNNYPLVPGKRYKHLGAPVMWTAITVVPSEPWCTMFPDFALLRQTR